MSGGFIQPTVTQRVRSFLTRSAVDVRPWAGLAATYEALYALFRQRRADPAFWGSLTDLMHEIVDGVVEAQKPGRLPAPQAELLSSWDVDELVHKLRSALCDAEDDGPRDSGRPAWSVFSARLSPAVLGGFLLLGLAAAGCDTGDTGDVLEPSEEDAGPDTGAAPGTGGQSGTDAAAEAGDLDGSSTAGCDLAAGSVLQTTIDQSSLSDVEKQQLSQCFGTLGASWCQGLTELFQSTATAEQKAAALEQMLFCCSSQPSTFGAEYTDVQRDALLAGSLCPVVVYKGVSFPD